MVVPPGAKLVPLTTARVLSPKDYDREQGALRTQETRWRSRVEGGGGYLSIWQNSALAAGGSSRPEGALPATSAISRWTSAPPPCPGHGGLSAILLISYSVPAHLILSDTQGGGGWKGGEKKLHIIFL